MDSVNPQKMPSRRARHLPAKGPKRWSIRLAAILIAVSLLFALGVNNRYLHDMKASELRMQSVRRHLFEHIANGFGESAVLLERFADDGDTYALRTVQTLLRTVTDEHMRHLDAKCTDYLNMSSDLGSALWDTSELFKNAVHLLFERSHYFYRFEQPEQRFLNHIRPALKSFNDAVMGEQPSASSQEGMSDAAALEALSRIKAVSLLYTQQGDEPSAPTVAEEKAILTAYEHVRWAPESAAVSAVECFDTWKDLHFWKITLTQQGTTKTHVAYVDAQQGTIMGSEDYHSDGIPNTGAPRLSRGEALLKARGLIHSIPGAPDQFEIGPVEFNGTWRVTFWPKTAQIVFYSHPIHVLVDDNTAEPVGYQNLSGSLPVPAKATVTTSAAVEIAQSSINAGYLADSLVQYRGDTKLAVVRSQLKREDVLVWSVEYVISKSFHERTGYDMAGVLVNANTGELEGCFGLGDGARRVDWWPSGAQPDLAVGYTQGSADLIPPYVEQ